MSALDFEKSLAIVIGINQYGNGITPLRTAVADAQSVAELLEQKHEYKVISLLDEQAQLADLTKLIRETLPNLLSANSRLLLYFAGHGIAQDGDDGPAGYLIPKDAEPGNVASYLSMVALHDALTALPCRHFLAIFDCCFAGAFRWSSTRKITVVSEVIHRERYDRFRQDPAWQVITSASYDQPALDVLSLRDERGEIVDGNAQHHSPFAAALIQALQGEADTSPPAKDNKPAGDGVTTATELYLYLRDRVEVLTESQRLRQTPEICTLCNHDKGEYIFLTPGHELNLPPAPALNKENNPYRALESFDQAHKDLFFGRDAEIENLLKKLDEPHPMVVVLGASGTGKSSLVKAGLLPRLADDPAFLVLPVMRPGNYPLKALARICTGLDLAGEVKALHQQFKENEQSLALLIGAWQKTHPTTKLLLVIDQAEELITQARTQADSKQFQQLVKLAMAEHGRYFRVVATLRLDFEAQFQEAELRDAWMDSRFVIPPMGQVQLREAIEKPAAARVLYFEPSSLVDKLVEDVTQTPGALPLLSFTLSELYLRYLERRSENRALTEVDYRALGGVAGSLTRRATQEYELLVAEDRAYEQTIKHVMLRMVAVAGGELARRRVPLSELVYEDAAENGRVQKLLEKLIESRLVVRGQEGAGEPYVEPAHDALVRSWDKLLRWKNEAQEDLILQRKLASQAKDWALSQQTEGLTKARGFLWDDNPRLDLLAKTAAADAYWLNKLETTFVATSVKKKRTLRRRRVASVITVISLLSGLAFTALTAAVRAVGRQIEAYSTASEANLLSNQDLDALANGLQAGRALHHPLFQLSNPSTQLIEKTKGTLYKAIYSARENNRLLAHRHGAYQLSYSPDGKRLVTVGDDDALRLWTADGQLLDESMHHQQINAELVKAGKPLFVPAVDFGADGKTVATGDSNGNVVLWTIENDKLTPVQTVSHTQSVDQRMVRYVTFSPSGEQLATGGDDGILRIWDVSARKTLDSGEAVSKPFVEQSAELPRSPGKIWGIAYSSDGETIAIARGSSKEEGLEGMTYLWNVKDLKNDSLQPLVQPFARCEGHTGSVRNVKFHPQNSSRLVTTGQDATVNLWEIKRDDPASGCQLVKPLKGHSSQVWGIDFSPNGQQMITAAENVILWDAEGNEKTVLNGNKDGLWSVQFNPIHEHLLATAGKDGTVRFWDLSDKFKKLTLNPDTRARDIDFSQTGDRLVVGGSDGSIRLWNWPQNWKETGRALEDVSALTCKGHQGTVYGVSLSPDDSLLAAAAKDGNLYLWDVTNEVCRMRGSWFANDKIVRSVEFHPENNHVLATAGQDGTVRLWDLKNAEQWPQGRSPLPAFQAHQTEAADVSFNHDGSWLATVGADAAVRVWDVDRLFEQLKLSEGASNSLVARELIAPQSLLAECRGNQQWVLGTDFHPTQNLLVSSDAGGTVILWDLTELKTKGCQEVWTITTHRDSVYSVDFSPDGTMVAVGDKDGSVRLWDLAGNPVGEFPGHTGTIWSAEFSPDGQALITSDNSRTLKVWPIEDLNGLILRACNWAPIYFSDQKYRDFGVADLRDEFDYKEFTAICGS